MRFIKAVIFFAGSCLAFTNRFFDLFKSVIPYILQMLLGWCLFFAALYQLVHGVRELVKTIRGKQEREAVHGATGKRLE